VYGIAAVVADAPLEAEGVEPEASQSRLGGNSTLYRVIEPAPQAWWPRSLTPAPSPMAALRAVGGAADPVADLVVSRTVPHQPGAEVRLLRDTPDEIEVEVSGGGGVLALRRTYQPLYRAEAEGKALRTQPVDLSLLGVEV